MLLLMASLTAIGVTYVGILSKQLTAIVAERNQKSELATAMRALHEARYQSLLLASATTDPFMRDEEIMRFSAQAREFIQLRENFLTLPLDEVELPLWQHIRGTVRELELRINETLELLQAGRLEDARRQVIKTIQPAQKTVMEEWDRLVDMQRQKNQEALTEARAAADQAKRLTLSLSATTFLVGLIIAVFVIRRSRRMEIDLFEQKEQAQITLQTIGDAVIRFDEEQRITYLNPAAEQLLGIRTDSALGQTMESVLRLVEKMDRSPLVSAIGAHTLMGNVINLPNSAYLISGPDMEFEVEGSSTPIHSPDGTIIGGVLVMRDVTEDRELHRKLLWQADHDPLTGLMNRRAFNEKISRILVGKRANEFPLSVLYMDLDHFKPVNDQAGHAAGDELLRRIAQLMRDRIRDTDTLARMGGDEFAIVLSPCPPTKAEEIAHGIREAINRYGFQWDGQTFHVAASIGIVHVPPHWSNLDDCLVAADAACYKAKNSGRDRVVVHSEATP